MVKSTNIVSSSESFSLVDYPNGKGLTQMTVNLKVEQNAQFSYSWTIMELCERYCANAKISTSVPSGSDVSSLKFLTTTPVYLGANGFFEGGHSTNSGWWNNVDSSFLAHSTMHFDWTYVDGGLGCTIRGSLSSSVSEVSRCSQAPYLVWKASNRTTTAPLIIVLNVEVIQNYTITFKNWDNSVLQTKSCSPGTLPSYTGGTPTKPGSAQYSYTFSGWTPAITSAQSNATYTAKFTSVVNQYLIQFVDGDGNTIQSTKVNYGDTPSCSKTPTKTESATETYDFAGWDRDITPVVGDATYYAQFDASPKYFQVVFRIDGANYQSNRILAGEWISTPPYSLSPTEYVENVKDTTGNGVSKYRTVYSGYKWAVGDAKYSPGDQYQVNSSVVFVAEYTRTEEYLYRASVIFETNGGTPVNNILSDWESSQTVRSFTFPDTRIRDKSMYWTNGSNRYKIGDAGTYRSGEAVVYSAEWYDDPEGRAFVKEGEWAGGKYLTYKKNGRWYIAKNVCIKSDGKWDTMYHDKTR